MVSVDINSGMDGDTGEVEIAVRSGLTVTIGYVKTGLLSENAARHMRRLVCVDIGIVLEREEEKICTQREWEAHCASAGVSSNRAALAVGGTAYRRCPPYLDMDVIRISGRTPL